MTSRDELVAFSRKARHDLQNPVAAVTLALELAQDEIADAAATTSRTWSAGALRSAERLSEALDASCPAAPRTGRSRTETRELGAPGRHGDRSSRRPLAMTSARR